MALENTWTRGRPSKGLRQLNLRYEVSEERFKPIEDLLERVPYKRVNEIMREALLLGSKIMLSTADGGNLAALATTPATRNSATKAAATQAPPAVVEQPKGFGKAATSMFEQYGEQGKDS